MLKDNLIMLRNMRGFSQEEIAGRINISRQAYAKWESGARNAAFSPRSTA